MVTTVLLPCYLSQSTGIRTAFNVPSERFQTRKRRGACMRSSPPGRRDASGESLRPPPTSRRDPEGAAIRFCSALSHTHFDPPPRLSALSARRTMSSGQQGPKSPALTGGSGGESKARGANRSTKVAGKLKVLPEHAEPVLNDKAPQPSAPPRDREEAGEGSGTLADSEEEEAEDEEEPEDVEVRPRPARIRPSAVKEHFPPVSVLTVCSLRIALALPQVYNQIDLIPAGTARRDALRLTKKKAKSLPRVTAYATARCVTAVVSRYVARL